MYKHAVQYYETDKMGITHHSNYIRWMEEARIDFLKKIGFSYDKLEADGIISPVIGLECSYKKATTFGDTVSIEVAVAEFKGIRLKIGYTMTNDAGELVCEGVSSHCFVSKEGRPIHIRKQFPDFYAALSELVNL